MTTHTVVFGKEARQKLFVGIEKLSQAVISTLGPRSRNVAVDIGSYAIPRILHDGASVARSIILKDSIENMGASLIKEAAATTNDEAGDGTTTATLLAYTLIKNGLELIDSGIIDGVMVGKINPMELRERLMQESLTIESRLTELAVILKESEIKNIALVSSGDEAIATDVADAITAIGRDGVILVEESGLEKKLAVVEGMELEHGYLSPYFVTNPDRMITEYEDGYILVTDQTITDANDLVPIIEKVKAEGNKPLLIIANDVFGPAFNSLVLTKMKLGQPLVAIAAPEFGDLRKQVLDDIALVYGGKLITAELNLRIRETTLAQLGRFSKLTVTATHTTIVPKDIDVEEVNQRIDDLKKQLKDEKNDWRKQRLEVRINRLAGKIGILYVGSGIESERKELKERYIDAIHAVKAALAEGVIPGGGIALYDLAQEYETDAFGSLVKTALEAPYKQLLFNSGEADRKRTSSSVLYDVVTKKEVSLSENHIYDPVKVTRLAVLNAFKVAAMVLTTDSVVAVEPEDIQHVKAV